MAITDTILTVPLQGKIKFTLELSHPALYAEGKCQNQTGEWNLYPCRKGDPITLDWYYKLIMRTPLCLINANSPAYNICDIFNSQSSPSLTFPGFKFSDGCSSLLTVRTQPCVWLDLQNCAGKKNEEEMCFFSKQPVVIEKVLLFFMSSVLCIALSLHHTDF